MNKRTMWELGSAVIFCLVAVLLLNPMDFWMPTMAHFTLLAVLFAAFGSFIVFALGEQHGDEREEANRAVVGRVAYLSGAAILLVGVAVQSFGHVVDPWLVGALILMILARVGSFVWTERYH